MQAAVFSLILLEAVDMDMLKAELHASTLVKPVTLFFQQVNIVTSDTTLG